MEHLKLVSVSKSTFLGTEFHTFTIRSLVLMMMMMMITVVCLCFRRSSRTTRPMTRGFRTSSSISMHCWLHSRLLLHLQTLLPLLSWCETSTVQNTLFVLLWFEFVEIL